jgi:hypothetical protein
VTKQNDDIIAPQYYFVEDKKSILLMTFIWFTPTTCHVPKLVEVNQFDKKTKKWKDSEFSFEKFENFYGCQLGIELKTSNPEFVIANRTNSMKLEGYGVEIIGVVSEALHFKFRFRVFEFFNYKKDVHNDKLTVDLEIETRSNHEVNLTGHKIQLYVPTADYFVVPPGSPYDGYIKFILPFDWPTWILSVLTFFVAFFVIFIVHRMRSDIRDIVFGENVLTPSWNVLAHFFGLSQIVMPRKNFARFLVMSFILLSFMIRNLYQGMMCDYLQSDMREAQRIQSFNDILNYNYSLYIDAQFKWSYDDSQKLRLLFGK